VVLRSLSSGAAVDETQIRKELSVLITVSDYFSGMRSITENYHQQDVRKTTSGPCTTQPVLHDISVFVAKVQNVAKEKESAIPQPAIALMEQVKDVQRQLDRYAACISRQTFILNHFLDGYLR
jgi:hypothetical protein